MANQYVNKIVINGQTKIDLTGDTVTEADILKGKTAHDRSGAPIVGTCEYDANTSDATALAAEILTGKSAYVAGTKVNGTMPNRGAAGGTIATKDGEYTIQQGYHDGSGKVGIDATEKEKLVPANIREGVTVLGVVGTMSGSESVKAESKEVTPTFSDQIVTPDTSGGYNYISQVTVKKIPVTETDNAQGGVTVTVG